VRRVRPTPQSAVFLKVAAMILFVRADFDPVFALCDFSCFRLERVDLASLFDPAAPAGPPGPRLHAESLADAASAPGTLA
jgi:hypothetical protein